MATQTQSPIIEKLVDYIQDAHAMETDVKLMLGSMIATTKDGEIRDRLELHRQQTDRQLQRLEQRLAYYGREASMRKELQTIAAAIGKGMVDAVRGDKAGKNARDGYVTEHLEIAAYQLLERLAMRAGDAATAEVARQNMAEEMEMSRFIEEHWDRFIELTLQENGISAVS